jgi:hydroxypyruvate isomerase
MPRFAANLSMLWPELDVYDRFRAAAEAGFTRVEILFLHLLDVDHVAQLLNEHRLELVLFDPRPGNWEAGERGLLSLPGREDEFEASIDEALATATRLGARRLNALAGILSPEADQAVAEETAVRNLQRVASRAASAGVLLLIENINLADMPGYFTPTVDRAARLVQLVDRPNVRLQLDQYHVGMMGEDARELFERYGPMVEHVQIADVPGRHEPGTGQQPIGEFLALLDRDGYSGAVGLEYRPAGDTSAALAWLPREGRQ